MADDETFEVTAVQPAETWVPPISVGGWCEAYGLVSKAELNGEPARLLRWIPPPDGGDSSVGMRATVEWINPALRHYSGRIALTLKNIRACAEPEIMPAGAEVEAIPQVEPTAPPGWFPTVKEWIMVVGLHNHTSINGQLAQINKFQPDGSLQLRFYDTSIKPVAVRQKNMVPVNKPDDVPWERPPEPKKIDPADRVSMMTHGQFIQKYGDANGAALWATAAEKPPGPPRRGPSSPASIGSGSPRRDGPSTQEMPDSLGEGAELDSCSYAKVEDGTGGWKRRRYSSLKEGSSVCGMRRRHYQGLFGQCGWALKRWCAAQCEEAEEFNKEMRDKARAKKQKLARQGGKGAGALEAAPVVAVDERRWRGSRGDAWPLCCAMGGCCFNPFAVCVLCCYLVLDKEDGESWMDVDGACDIPALCTHKCGHQLWRTLLCPCGQFALNWMRASNNGRYDRMDEYPRFGACPRDGIPALAGCCCANRDAKAWVWHRGWWDPCSCCWKGPHPPAPGAQPPEGGGAGYCEQLWKACGGPICDVLCTPLCCPCWMLAPWYWFCGKCGSEDDEECLQCYADAKPTNANFMCPNSSWIPCTEGPCIQCCPETFCRGPHCWYTLCCLQCDHDGVWFGCDYDDDKEKGWLWLGPIPCQYICDVPTHSTDGTCAALAYPCCAPCLGVMLRQKAKDVGLRSQFCRPFFTHLLWPFFCCGVLTETAALEYGLRGPAVVPASPEEACLKGKGCSCTHVCPFVGECHPAEGGQWRCLISTWQDCPCVCIGQACSCIVAL